MICGSSLDRHIVGALMNGETAHELVFAFKKGTADHISSFELGQFGGSGSTLIAAHKTGRRGYLCELDPIYCDRILRRWEIFAKDDAELIACGLESRPPSLAEAA